jgi:enoyl-CoA hydratase/carnithine racemase
VLLIGVNRPDKRNAWDLDAIRGVAKAYTDLAADDDLRVGVVFGHGDVFTAGLDLASVAPLVAEDRGAEILPAGLRDPWDLFVEPCPKPIILAVHGRCYTLGIELALASQVTVAAEGTLFAQLEMARGIVPLGGASFRLLARPGAKGMQWFLTAEQFGRRRRSGREFGRRGRAAGNPRRPGARDRRRDRRQRAAQRADGARQRRPRVDTPTTNGPADFDNRSL